MRGNTIIYVIVERQCSYGENTFYRGPDRSFHQEFVEYSL